MQTTEKEIQENQDQEACRETTDRKRRTAAPLEEITIEELAVDGICGIY